MKNISVSFLKYENNIEYTLEKIEMTNADYIHVDVMDGKFVPGTFIPLGEEAKYLTKCHKPLDVHLMVEEPREYILSYQKLNTRCISIQIEIKEDIDSLIDLIHSFNIKAGLAISPDTNIEKLYQYLNKIDYIIVLGVTPGAGGQELIRSTISKVDVLKKKRRENNYHYEIAFDGGVNDKTVDLLKEVDTLIVGSFITTSKSYQDSIDILR